MLGMHNGLWINLLAWVIGFKRMEELGDPPLFLKPIIGWYRPKHIVWHRTGKWKTIFFTIFTLHILAYSRNTYNSSRTDASDLILGMAADDFLKFLSPPALSKLTYMMRFCWKKISFWSKSTKSHAFLMWCHVSMYVSINGIKRNKSIST